MAAFLSAFIVPLIKGSFKGRFADIFQLFKALRVLPIFLLCRGEFRFAGTILESISVLLSGFKESDPSS